MIEKLANGMTLFYIKNNYISRMDINSYKYGFEILLSTVCNIVLAAAISILFKSLFEALFYLAAFISVRIVGGGYHAKTHKSCIFIFSSAFFSACLIIKLMVDSIIPLFNIFCAILSSLVIWKVAPVEAPNKPLSGTKRKRYEAISLVLGCLFIVLALISYLTILIPNSITVHLFLGELTAAFSMIAGSRKRKEEEHENAVT